jgi:hypothetical protein
MMGKYVKNLVSAALLLTLCLAGGSAAYAGGYLPLLPYDYFHYETLSRIGAAERVLAGREAELARLERASVFGWREYEDELARLRRIEIEQRRLDAMIGQPKSETEFTWSKYRAEVAARKRRELALRKSEEELLRLKQEAELERKARLVREAELARLERIAREERLAKIREEAELAEIRRGAVLARAAREAELEREVELRRRGRLALIRREEELALYRRGADALLSGRETRLRAEARALATTGDIFAEEGRYSYALQKYEQAYNLYPSREIRARRDSLRRIVGGF